MIDKIEYTAKNMIGKQDYQMKNKEYTNRYENFNVMIFDKEKELYQTFETDKKKGMRFIVINSDGSIYRERKWPRSSNRWFRFINPNKNINNMDPNMNLDKYKLK